MTRLKVMDISYCFDILDYFILYNKYNRTSLIKLISLEILLETTKILKLDKNNYITQLHQDLENLETKFDIATVRNISNTIHKSLECLNLSTIPNVNDLIISVGLVNNRHLKLVFQTPLYADKNTRNMMGIN